MSSQTPISPRQEALDAIKRVRADVVDPSIPEDAWAAIVGVAWEHRSQLGDRREIQRELRELLLEASREGGAGSAAQ